MTTPKVLFHFFAQTFFALFKFCPSSTLPKERSDHLQISTGFLPRSHLFFLPPKLLFFFILRDLSLPWPLCLRPFTPNHSRHLRWDYAGVRAHRRRCCDCFLFLWVFVLISKMASLSMRTIGRQLRSCRLSAGPAQKFSKVGGIRFVSQSRTLNATEDDLPGRGFNSDQILSKVKEEAKRVGKTEVEVDAMLAPGAGKICSIPVGIFGPKTDFSRCAETGHYHGLWLSTYIHGHAGHHTS